MAQINEAAAAFGLVVQPPDTPDEDEEELWPENESAVRLFSALLSQWRVGMAGPTGLDYAAVPVAAAALRLRGRSLRVAFAGMQTMEAEALRMWRSR